VDHFAAASSAMNQVMRGSNVAIDLDMTRDYGTAVSTPIPA
jgi:hypothetical protein